MQIFNTSEGLGAFKVSGSKLYVKIFHISSDFRVKASCYQQSQDGLFIASAWSEGETYSGGLRLAVTTSTRIHNIVYTLRPGSAICDFGLPN